jgi:hypothetical protein
MIAEGSDNSSNLNPDHLGVSVTIPNHQSGDWQTSPQKRLFDENRKNRSIAAACKENSSNKHWQIFPIGRVFQLFSITIFSAWRSVDDWYRLTFH